MKLTLIVPVVLALVAAAAPGGQSNQASHRNGYTNSNGGSAGSKNHAGTQAAQKSKGAATDSTNTGAQSGTNSQGTGSRTGNSKGTGNQVATNSKGTGSQAATSSTGTGNNATTNALVTTTSTGATNAAANNNAAANSNTAASNNGDPQTSLTLDPAVIATGFAQNGQENATEPGQVPSLTSTNNFINFCATTNQPITNGQQITTGSCNPAPMGSIPSTQNIPSAKFVFPTNFATIPANQQFNIQLAIQGIETGNFVNAETNYFSAPQQLNADGLIVGHSHIVCESITSLVQTTLTDPTKFAFFKGLNAAAVNGQLTANVTDGLPAGSYRCSSITTSANHAPVLVAVAQHGAVDDAVYITCSDNSTDSNNAGGAQSTATGSATTTTAATGGNNGQNNNGQNGGNNGKNSNGQNGGNNGKNNNGQNGGNNGKNSNGGNGGTTTNSGNGGNGGNRQGRHGGNGGNGNGGKGGKGRRSIPSRLVL